MLKIYRDFEEFKADFSKWLQKKLNEGFEGIKAKVVCSDQLPEDENIFCVLPTCWKHITSPSVVSHVFYDMANHLGLASNVIIYEQQWELEAKFMRL